MKIKFNVIIIGLFFLISSFLNISAMETRGTITIPTRSYTANTLENYGTMAYSPLTLHLNNCQSLLNYCDIALKSDVWWETQFEPVCSVYTKQFLKIYNPDTHFVNNNSNSLEIGEFCLRFIRLTLKKIILKLSETAHYQTSIVQNSNFNPHDSRSEWLRNKREEIYTTQNNMIPKLMARFSHSFDTIFFQEITTLIQKFDDSIERINYSNSGLEKTKNELQLFMESLDQIITKEINSKNETHFQSNIFHAVLHFGGLLALSYWFDSQ